MEPRFVESVGGARLAWDERGDGAPVLLVHGIGFRRQRWDPQVDVLAPAGFRVVRFDLRGFGDSTLPEGESALPEFLADFEAIVGEAGLDTFHLVGHSLGGMLSMRYAADHPERIRSLTVASGTSHNGRRATAFARIMVAFSERGFDAVMNDAAGRPEMDVTLREAFGGMDPPLEMLRTGLEKPHRARAAAWRACIDYSTKDDLARLTCPVFVTHGSADPLIPFKAGELIHEAIPHSEWKAEYGAGHSLPRERAESFNALLLDFLRRAEASWQER